MPMTTERALAHGGAGEARFHPAVLDFDVIEGRVERSLLKKVHRLIDEFPDRAVEVIRAWMAKGA